MRAKLDDGEIRHVIRERGKGTPAPRWRGAWISAHATCGASGPGTGVPARCRRSAGGGRPAAKTVSDGAVRLVPVQCRSGGSGVGRVTKAPAGKNISGRTAHHIMKERGLAEPCPARAKRRKRVRFERRHSDAMRHTDWHVMRDFRMRGLGPVTYPDDASRCVTGYGVFGGEAGPNAVRVPRRAVGASGRPASVLSDDGSCLVGVRGDDAPKGAWTPTIFENELPDMGTRLINSRPYHPQTNGKLERFHRTLETEVGRHDSPGDFITYYNERRLHWSLDMDNRQTPPRRSVTRRRMKP